MAGRGKGAAAPTPAPAKKKGSGGSVLLALLAAALVMLLASIWLGSKPSSVGRVDASAAPSVALGIAVYVAVLVGRKKLTWPAMITAAVLGAVAAGVLVNTGGQPGLGRAMAGLGSMLPPNATACDPAPAGKARATSPGGRTCLVVPKCPAGKAPQWGSGDQPTGKCVREAA